MDEQYFENVLKAMSERQTSIKNALIEAQLRSTDEDEKIKIQSYLDMNDELEQAINNKDIDKLQKIYSNANNDKTSNI